MSSIGSILRSGSPKIASIGPNFLHSRLRRSQYTTLCFAQKEIPLWQGAFRTLLFSSASLSTQSWPCRKCSVYIKTIWLKKGSTVDTKNLEWYALVVVGRVINEIRFDRNQFSYPHFMNQNSEHSFSWSLRSCQKFPFFQHLLSQSEFFNRYVKVIVPVIEATFPCRKLSRCWTEFGISIYSFQHNQVAQDHRSKSFHYSAAPSLWCVTSLTSSYLGVTNGAARLYMPVRPKLKKVHV